MGGQCLHCQGVLPPFLKAQAFPLRARLFDLLRQHQDCPLNEDLAHLLLQLLLGYLVLVDPFVAPVLEGLLLQASLVGTDCVRETAQSLDEQSLLPPLGLFLFY